MGRRENVLFADFLWSGAAPASLDRAWNAAEEHYVSEHTRAALAAWQARARIAEQREAELIEALELIKKKADYIRAVLKNHLKGAPAAAFWTAIDIRKAASEAIAKHKGRQGGDENEENDDG